MTHSFGNGANLCTSVHLLHEVCDLSGNGTDPVYFQKIWTLKSECKLLLHYRCLTTVFALRLVGAVCV